MRILITWGSKLGGTADIGMMLGDALIARGFEVVRTPAISAPSLTGFDAVIVGGALYANRWHPDARRFVDRHAAELRRIPTWLFSSGPLDDTADGGALAPPRSVTALVDRIGAQGHVTFGGRLEKTATGFMAAAMAKKHAGDWRNRDQIRTWANEVGDAIPSARPRPVSAPVGRAPMRVVEYGVVAWAGPAAVLVAAAAALPQWLALVTHVMVMTIWFAYLGERYQRPAGAHAPPLVAAVWVVVAAAIDLVLVAPQLAPQLVLARSFTALWLPLVLGFSGAWAAGAIGAMRPFPSSAIQSAG